MTLQKLVSINPNRYEEIDINRLAYSYAQYLNEYVAQYGEDEHAKDFIIWLDTEI